VELLVMRALSLKLLSGEIDQVKGVVLVSGVTARILTLDQIAAMQQRVKLWTEHVQTTLVAMEGGANEIGQ
jgi:exo-beta-1,3-glucanase (GH17 family)